MVANHSREDARQLHLLAAALMGATVAYREKCDDYVLRVGRPDELAAMADIDSALKNLCGTHDAIHSLLGGMLADEGSSPEGK